jgi:endonuclease/exonuclease/phosphatase (EEP) superfamily protein YafD
LWLLNGGFNFLPYAGVPFVLLIGGVALFRQRRATILACAPLAVWGCAMLATNFLFAFARPCADDGNGTHLRIVSANVLMHNAQLDELAQDILRQDPDVIVFQELLSDIETFSPELAAAYPYRVSTEVQWMTIASRLPLDNGRRLTVGYKDRARDPLATTINVGGQPITLLGLHAVPPRSKTTFDEHREQYELLEREVSNAPGPVLVVGDFNATLLSPYFANFLMSTGLRIASSERFQRATYHPTRWMGVRIDHVLLSGMSVCDERVIDLAGSDHEGVVVDVRVDSTPSALAGR